MDTSGKDDMWIVFTFSIISRRKSQEFIVCLLVTSGTPLATQYTSLFCSILWTLWFSMMSSNILKFEHVKSICAYNTQYIFWKFYSKQIQIFMCHSLTCISCLVMLLLDMVLIPQSSPQTSQYPGNILLPHQSTQLAQLYHFWCRQLQWVARSDRE